MATPAFSPVSLRKWQPAPSIGRRTALMIRMAWTEARRSYALILLPLLVVAGVWLALQYFRVDLLFWHEVSANIALTFVLIGPVCSGWGAWLAGREPRRRLSELFSAAPTPAIGRDAVVFGTAVAGALMAHALVALIVGSYTATYATWGGPSLQVIAFGALISAAMALCGSVLGRVWPVRISPFVAVLAPLLYIALTYSYFKSWDGQRWLAPYAYLMDWKQRPLNVLYEQRSMPYDHYLFGGALAALGVGLLAFVVLVSVRRQWRVAAMGGLVAVAILVSARAETQPVRVDVPSGSYDGPRPAEAPPLSCAGDVVETCLHQVYKPELHETAARIDGLFAPIDGLPGVPERIEQRADLETSETVLRFDRMRWTRGVLPAHGAMSELVWPMITGTDLRENQPLDGPQHVISRWLVIGAGYGSYHVNSAAEIENPFQNRPASGTANGSTIPTVSHDVRTAYFDELAAYNEEITVAAERFAALSPEDQRAWLEANWEALRAGELTLEDLP